MSDEQNLESRLHSALARGLDDDPVDVRSLLDGARTGAARIRRRRATVTAGVATLLVVSVPVGLGLLPDEEGAGPPAASSSVTALATPEPSPVTPTPVTPTPSSPSALPSSPSRPLVSLASPTSFPDAAALTGEDFDRTVTLLLDEGDYVNGPTVQGQACGNATPADHAVPTARRSWMWAEQDSNDLDQLQVELTLTGWDGGGSEAMDDVTQDSGRCTWPEPVDPAPAEDLPGDGRWAGSAARQGLHAGYAVVELGDVLIAVSVVHPGGQEAAVAEAKRLVVLAATRTEAALT